MSKEATIGARFGRTSLKTQPEKQLSRDQSVGRLEEGLVDKRTMELTRACVLTSTRYTKNQVHR